MDAVETMAYAAEGGVPWHGLGTPVTGAKDAKTMAQMGGIDWEVGLMPTQVVLQGVQGLIDGSVAPLSEQAVTRLTDGRVFGLVRDYIPLQNWEAFEFLDELAAAGALEYETVGALFDGAKIFLLARVPGEITFGRGKNKEVMVKYLYLYTGHDGETATYAFPCITRVVCWNTHRVAFREAKRNGLLFRFEHRGDIKQHVAEARNALDMSTVEFGTFADMAKTLDAVTFTIEQTTEAVRSVFTPPPADSEKWVKTKYEILEATVNENIGMERPSAWGVLNGITGYMEHQYQMPGRAEDPLLPDRRQDFRLQGRGAEVKAKAVRIVAQMAGIYDDLMREREEQMVKVRAQIAERNRS